eukprot:4510853-Pyramimonas_sp.AAC.1
MPPQLGPEVVDGVGALLRGRPERAPSLGLVVGRVPRVHLVVHLASAIVGKAGIPQRSEERTAAP